MISRKTLIICAALLLASLITLLLMHRLKVTLQSQLAAERFSGPGGERFSQISAFYPINEGITLADIEAFQRSLEDKFKEASIADPVSDTASNWIDAYSIQGSVSVTGSRNRRVTATAIGVGGDFFFFHPLQLKSGSYITANDIMRDRVILDEQLAWQLFGSYNVAGLEVGINGMPYVIAGVIAREYDFASSTANNSDASIFLPFELLTSDSAELQFTCYEAVLPEPLSGFAEELVSNSVLSTPGMELIQNTGRFSTAAIWANISGFGKNAMRTGTALFPYWENAALIIEDYLTLLFVLSILFALTPLFTLFLFIFRLWRFLGAHKALILDRLDDFRDSLRQKLKRRKNN